ncbi:hypothetical protein HMN09_01377700 [Mycena chlorophos]|uniref:Uncharacterized protein n=1 Tax=Mycena chlorophos TaxID=658473 RepID=A0A8H6RYQ6_MYCCL|nr:hypothetical protein HMN09_01377700 [Mycena chlorophos]
MAFSYRELFFGGTTFCCCLRVRLGVLIMAVLGMLFAGILSILIWFEVSSTYDFTKGEKAAFVIAGLVETFLFVASMIGFIGTVVRKQVFVQAYAYFIYFHFLLNVGVAAFLLWFLVHVSTIDQHALCQLGLHNVDAQNQCTGLLQVGLGIYGAVAGAVLLTEAYGAVIVARYVNQIQREKRGARASRISRRSARMSARTASAAYSTLKDTSEYDHVPQSANVVHHNDEEEHEFDPYFDPYSGHHLFLHPPSNAQIVMQKRLYAQRKHIIQSLDGLCYQLHVLAFFSTNTDAFPLSTLLIRLLSQSQCSKPRELHPGSSLRAFCAVLVFLNLIIIWNHATSTVADKFIILDFIGAAFVPSKLRVISLDVFLLFLQTLTAILSYDTALAKDRDGDYESETEPVSPSPHKPSAYVLDLHFSTVVAHLRAPRPPAARERGADGLPLPNTTPWPLPAVGLRMLWGATPGRTRESGVDAGDGRIPGQLDKTDPSKRGVTTALGLGPATHPELDIFTAPAQNHSLPFAHPCIIVVVAVLLYFFYWNRLIAFALGVIFRILYWSQSPFSIWLEIGSIHFSLISGRILVKDFAYHSSNQTIRIVKGQIQWRYWIRRPASEDDIAPPRNMDDSKPTRSPSCRVQISVQGLEWFLYNRTAAYDNMVANMAPKPPLSRPTSRNTGRQSSTHQTYTASVLRVPAVLQRAWYWIRQELPTLDPKDLLPLGIEVTKGAIIIGNPSTPNLLVAEFKRTEGMFGIVQSRSKHDLYKQLLNLGFQQATIRYVHNENYRGAMATTGELLRNPIKKYSKLEQISSYLSYQGFTRVWRDLKIYSVMKKFPTNDDYASHTSLRSRSQGKHRSIDEETPVGADFTKLEYAIERKILEAPFVELTYYTDVVGEVPSDAFTLDLGTDDIGNGDMGPEFGVDLVIRGGIVRYGPWADRQRAELQRAFFPPTYQNFEPTPRLKPGDKRLWTALQVFVELRDDTTLYIPFREASKNWQWDGKTPMQRRPRKRDPASIHVTVGDRSSINYILPMVAGPTGYESVLEVHLDTVAVTSSLNDIQLVSAESCRIRGDLPSPLQWNVVRTWKFGISLRLPVLYLLRDHINMFTDLAKDWASGPPSDWHRFVPMKYTVEVDLHHYELNLYVNDNNIIDKPLIKEENALLIARATRLRSVVHIPSDTFRPESTTVPFSIEAPDLAVNLSLPRWNTWALHAPKDGNSIGKVRVLKFEGSYRYFSDVAVDHVEQLKLNITVRDLAYKALGWSIRYFMILQANYFGSFTTFSTLYEYLEKRKQGIQGDPVMLQYREGQRNMMEVDLDLDLQKGTLVLPAGLPGYEGSESLREQTIMGGDIGSALVLDVPELQVHFRLHDYYMDLCLNVGPIVGSISPNYPEKMAYVRLTRRPEEVLVLDRIDLTANRLLGPAPGTIAYVCMWEIKLGTIKTILTAHDLAVVSAAGKSFMLNFTDVSNAPAVAYQLPSYPDITAVRFSLQGLEATWRVDRNAVSVSLPRGLSADLNDAAGQHHRKFTRLSIPSIVVRFLVRSLSAARRWLEAGSLETSLHLDIYSAPLGWKETAAQQAAFVAEQDAITGRAKLMLAGFIDRGPTHLNGVYLPHPRNSDRRHYRSGQPAPSRQSQSSASKRARWQKLAHLSDSDGGEDMLDTDRDAALAKLRGGTPIAHIDDDDEEPMSGDESDTDGLGRDSSSDDDWSDVDAPEDQAIPRLKQYSRICGQYVSFNLETPSRWEASPFSALKPRLHRASEPGKAPTSLPFPVRPDPGSSTTVYRVRSDKGVDVVVTPLVLAVLDGLESDFGASRASPELLIDSLLSEYISAFGKKQAVPSSAMFDVRLSLVQMRLYHHVTLPSSGPSYVSSVLLMSRDIRTSGASRPSGMLLDAKLGEISVELEPLAAGGKQDITRVSLSGLSVGLSKLSPDIVLGRTGIFVGHGSLEHIAALGSAVSGTARDLAVIGKKWTQHTSTVTYDVVYHILAASRTKPVMDPLSAIQPSFLVQTGVPRALRLDTGFRFIFHLRNCLWEMSSNSFVPICDLVDLKELLEARLAVLDSDALNEDHVSPLYTLLPKLQPSPDMEESPASDVSVSGSFELRELRVILSDPLGGAAGELGIADLVVRGQLRTFDFVEAAHGYQSMGISQVSLGHASRPKHQQITLALFAGDIHVAVSPRSMPFAQEVLRIKRQYAPAPPPGSTKIRNREIPARSITFSADIQRVQLQAAAENLVFEFGIAGLRLVTTLLTRAHQTSPRSVNVSTIFKELFLRARSPTDASVRSLQDILASITLSACKANSLIRYESTAVSQIRLVFEIGGFHFNVPRSALRLYRFIQEWRADFLPGIEATLRDLVAEMRKAPMKPLSPTPSRVTQLAPSFLIHGHVDSFGVSLQVMHGTWLSWRIFDVVAFLNYASGLKTSFGLRFGSQAFSITSKSNTPTATPDTKLKVQFPSVTVHGDNNGVQMQTIVLVDFLEFKVKPAHWDSLLTVQQKFGQDFNDLVKLVQETRSARPPAKEIKPPSPPSTLKYSGFLKMRGFRIGLEALSSTFFLECFDISGSINNLTRRLWSLTLTDLALSLAPKAVVEPRNSAFNRNRRSAFVIVDLEVRGGESAAEDIENVLQTTITKIHAVMQPSSIGEVGDFVDHLQAEMWDRKEQRAVELAAFKEKAQSILETLEVNVDNAEVKETAAWFRSYHINLSIHNIGVAFPLIHDPTLEIPQSGSRDSTAVRAFLFSIKSIKFGTRRGESGEARMQDLSFQFVSQFRQSVASDFGGENHKTRNRLVYPEMTAQIRSGGLVSARNIWMKATVSGFILDIDSSIPDYIFALIDVYEQGKERVSRLSASIPRTSTPTSNIPSTSASLELPTSNVFASLVFLSGKVRLYNIAASELSIATTMSHLQTQPSDAQVIGIGADVFNLPIVSVWAEYRATPAAQKSGNSIDAEPSVLVFKSTVHSSQNTLRPTTLLPFLTELVHRVERRMRQASRRSGIPQDVPDIPAPVSSTEIHAEPAPKPAAAADALTPSQRRFQMIFSLRIDQSKLELTCQPDVNVIAGLYWDSGGFVLHVTPSDRKVTLTASIAGLNIGLKHGFLSEEAAKLDMRNLTFSVTFAKTPVALGRSISSVSFVMDTEILGAVRFSRLQDVLCFKAVWLDRIPIFNANAAAEARPTTKSAIVTSMATSTSAVQEFTTLLLIRIRQISLEVDMGQSISSVTLDLKDAVAQTKITEEFNEVMLSVSDVAIRARGNLSGHASISNCVFQTIRRTTIDAENGGSRMLELRMTSDALVAVLESDHQKLLYYRAEPIEVDIFDDWSTVSPDSIASTDRIVRLLVSIASPEIVAVATVGTIPKLLAYANKFKANLETQREGASRESKTFHLSRIPNPENPLSAVAEAMIVSAKTRFQEADAGLSYVVKQRMSLRLGMLRLVIFPRTMGDLEMAQFIGNDVGAQLERLVKSDASPHRDLKLSFSFMAISRFTQLGHLAPPSIDVRGREWITPLIKESSEAIIVGLPSMNVHMVSEEKVDSLPTRALEYDFDSRFNRHGGQNFDDIYISLNVSLYSWLTLLRKNLTREMEQVKATAEWRTSVAPAGYRRKAVDNAQIQSELVKPSRTPAKATTIPHPPNAASNIDAPTPIPNTEKGELVFRPRRRHIERLTMKQLGEATPDVMHPFFMKKAGFNLEDSFPQYVNEYATGPLEQIMEGLLKLYTKQLLASSQRR